MDSPPPYKLVATNAERPPDFESIDVSQDEDEDEHDGDDVVFDSLKNCLIVLFALSIVAAGFFLFFFHR